VKQIIDRLFDWLERSVRDARQRELERYLSAATDAADLENRMRILARRGEL
jgi:hypothetical protein